MRRRRNWLWRAKWAGVACCVAILAAFTLSTQRRFEWINASVQHFVSLRHGAVRHAFTATPPISIGAFHPGWNVKLYPSGWSNWTLAGLELRLAQWRAGFTLVTIPLWMPFLAIGIPTAVMFFLDRRRIPPNHCHNCGYNLTGNVSGVCPECGTECAR